jgi:hypothetical protein
LERGLTKAHTGGAKRNELTGFTQVEIDFIAAYTRRGFKGAGLAYQDDHPKAAYSTCKSEAGRIMKRPKVSRYLAEVQEDTLKAASCTHVEHLLALMRLRDMATTEREYPSAVKAEELRGRAAGHYIEKHHHSGAVQTGFDPAKLAHLPQEDLDAWRRSWRNSLERPHVSAERAAILGQSLPPMNVIQAERCRRSMHEYTRQAWSRPRAGPQVHRRLAHRPHRRAPRSRQAPRAEVPRLQRPAGQHEVAAGERDVPLVGVDRRAARAVPVHRLG